MKTLNTSFGNLKINLSKLSLPLALIFCFSSQRSLAEKNSIGHSVYEDSTDKARKEVVYLSAGLDSRSKIILKWPKPTKINVSHFVVQRSEDGINFDDAALIFAPEPGFKPIDKYSYSEKVHSFDNDLLCYRLKIVDANGKCDYSDVAIVTLEKQDAQFAFSDEPSNSKNFAYWCTLGSAHAGIR